MKKVIKKRKKPALRQRSGQAKKKPVKKIAKKTKALRRSSEQVKKRTAPKKAKTKPKNKVVLRKIKAEKPIGVVTHFFTNIKVAVIKFKVPFKAGGDVRFKGATTDFAQKLNSMQFDHKPVASAKKGQGVGVKVAKRVREGDEVFKG